MAFVSNGQLGGLTKPSDERLVFADPGVPLRMYQAQPTKDPMRVYRTQPAVRKTVEFIARNFAVVPWHLYERKSGTDRERVTDHSLARLLRNPSPYWPAHRFRKFLIMDALLYDKWALAPIVGADGKARLVILPAEMLTFQSNVLREVSKVKVGDGPEAVEFEHGEVVYDFGWAAREAGGVSPMETLSTLIAELEAGAEYRRKLMKHAVASDMLITRPAGVKWSPEAKDRFRDDWQEFAASGMNAGKAPVLEDGMEPKAVPHNANAKTQDLEARRLSDAQAASAYLVPPELVGAVQGTFSNIDAFRQMIYGPVVGPWIEAFTDALNAMLVPMFGLDPDRFYIEANVRDRTRGSFMEEAAVTSASVGGPWMTRNEARARNNMPAIPGGDELIVPLNVVEGGLASPRDTAPNKAWRRGQQNLPHDPSPTSQYDRVDVKATGVAGKRAKTDLEATLAEHFETRTKAVLAVLEEKTAKAAGPATTAQLAAMYDMDGANAELAAAMQPHLVELAQLAADDVVGEYARDPEEWDPAVMDAWLTKAAESNAQQINAGWFDRLKTAVVGNAGWALAIKALLDDAVDAQAGVWAQTTGTEAYSFGGADAAKWSGLTSKTWEVTSGNPRASHAALAGETVELSDTFSNGARWPGDASLDAAENANCTCVVTYG